MSDVVIHAEGLGKKYIIGHEVPSERYMSLRDEVARGAKAFLRKARDLTQGRSVIEGDELEEFWALRDVDFEIRRGEVVGIIGRNGAGKSTLLKILSRITEPTTGRVRVSGHVASLLEVGTGFHSELTGRENIFLNGAILGMRRAEIVRKFDEIVAFAEVERFLDTPVKRYSSGMYVRLAFAVAAHLEPDILVVDEVLAVGDAEFQKKCLGKMHDVSRGGRTILFVSHNMSAVSTLCDRGFVFAAGNIAFDGPIRDALVMYSRSVSLPFAPEAGSPDIPRVVSIALDDKAAANGDIRIRVGFESPWELAPPLLGVVVTSNNGAPIFGFNTAMDPEFAAAHAKRGTIELMVKDAPLHSGLYKASIWLGEKSRNYARLDDAIVFDFVAPVPVPAGISLEYTGSVRVNGRFSLHD